MKRYKDAGITKDSSQEIEGLLRKGKSIASGRFHLLMCPRPDGRRGYVGSLQLGTGTLPPHLPLSEQDDMHGSSLHPTCISLSLSPLQEATDSSRTR